MRYSVLAAALLLSACASMEAPTAPATAAQPSAATASGIPHGESTSLNPADAPSGAYTLDGRHASVTWRLRHMGLGIFAARFDTISGSLNFDAANPANSSIDVTIAANSVSTGVLNREGQRAFDAEIANGVLGAEANPNIRFVSRSIQITGPTTGIIAGDLTLRGQTHPVTLEAYFEGGRFVTFAGKHVIAFTARTMIERSQWGANFGNPIVDGTTTDQVEILIAAEFRKD